MDSGCTKHVSGNTRLCTSYKAYDGGHVVFGSNLKGRLSVEVILLMTPLLLPMLSMLRRGNQFGNRANRFGIGRGNSFGNKGSESSKPKGACYNSRIEGHFASECRKPKENKAFMGGVWSDSEDGDGQLNDETCLMSINSQEVVSKSSSYNIDLNIIDLQKENEELLKFNKDFAKIFEKLLYEKRSLKKENSKLSSKINDLQIGCTKHMSGNRRLCTLYKAYDGGHVVFRSNLKGKVVGGGNIAHDSIIVTNVEHVTGLAFNLISVGQLCDDDSVVSFTKVDCDISKNGKLLAKGHKRNGLYTCKLGDNSKQQICLASVVDKSTLWHRRLGHANMRLVQNIASKKLVRNLPKLSFERHFCDTCSLGSQGHSQTSKAYIVLNKETTRIEESLNVTFDKSLPEPKSSSSLEDDRIDEPIVQDLNGSSSLQVNVSDEGYPKSLKEARDHPIEQVIGELNERTLRTYVKGMEVKQHY
nr:retrotransposon protein [Tanacetum cinerariifolium]